MLLCKFDLTIKTMNTIFLPVNVYTLTNNLYELHSIVDVLIAILYDIVLNEM